jgi:phage recombination protein Bet
MNTNGITRVENGLSLQADLQRKEVIETIKQTVARGATDAQLQMFLVLAGRYNLDPFLREIWCAQIGGQMTVLTSRDGYLKIAQRDPNFDGIVSATVCENDVFEIDPITPQVKHAFGAKRGRIIGAYAACFHKQRRPVVCFAPVEEYRKDTPTWKTYPSAMIVKVAEALSQAAVRHLRPGHGRGNRQHARTTRDHSCRQSSDPDDLCR